MGCPQVCAGATLQCSFGVAPTVFQRVAAEPHPDQRDAGGEHHGPHPAAEHSHLRPLPEPGQPRGGRRHRRRPRRTDADAVHSRHRQPVDPRRSADLLLGGMPALDANGTLICTWGGVIKISVPGQLQMLIP